MTKPNTIVIGGSKGLGKVISQTLVNAGHHVTVLSRSLEPEVDELLGRRCCRVDLTDKASREGWIEDTIKSGSKINHIIFAQRFRGSDDSWAGELETSLTATKHIIESLKDCFADTGEKTINVISSVYGQHVGDGQPVSYHVAKSALEQMVRYYAVNLGKSGIRVNGIAPGTYLKEESKDKILRNKTLSALYEKIVPLGRLATTDELSQIILFLTSSQSSYITGNVIIADGGLSLVYPETIALKLTD